QYPPAVRIKSDVKLTVARLGRSSCWRIEILVARNARRRRIWAAEARCPTTASGARQQFDCHVDAFAGRRIWHDLDGVLVGSIRHGADGGNLRVGAARRLRIGRLATVRAGAVLRAAIGPGISVNVKVVVRGAAAVIGPTQRDLDRAD